MNYIDTVIFGATALAYPIAARLGNDCLVVERGISAGAEFSDAMTASQVDMLHDFTGIAADFRDELLRRNILSDEGRLHILAVGGVLAGRYLETGCRLLLNSAAVSAEKTQSELTVTIFTPEEGYTRFQTRRVIDTRTADFMECGKIFGVLLAGDDSLDLFDDGEVYLQKGRFDDEYALRFRISRELTLPEAQEQADIWIRGNADRLGKAKAAGIALEFGWEFTNPVDITRDGVRYIPSAAYSDVISAVEGGESICL